MGWWWWLTKTHALLIISCCCLLIPHNSRCQNLNLQIYAYYIMHIICPTNHFQMGSTIGNRPSTVYTLPLDYKVWGIVSNIREAASSTVPVRLGWLHTSNAGLVLWTIGSGRPPIKSKLYDTITVMQSTNYTKQYSSFQYGAFSSMIYLFGDSYIGPNGWTEPKPRVFINKPGGVD